MMESRILGSRYELLEKVGMGGMATVYKATDKMLNRNVAVKILREEFKENEEFIRRFKVEAQAAACLSHQNIVQIYDVGEEDGLHYIVMELLEGVTLKKYMVSKGGKLSRREATNFSMQICRALEHAHSKHVVHRDIKPQNIVITESGKIKVADFGIARAANNSTMINSGTQAVGSAHYLSPEQARGGYTDQRSDLYSLGIVMYEMFTGKLPFDGEESICVIAQHLNEAPPLPSVVNPDIAPGIEAIILRSLRTAHRLRYENATEILEDLVAVYQNPGTNVMLLNACKGEENIDIAKVSSSRSMPRHRKKKRNTKKPLIIAAITFFAFIVILMGIIIKFVFFPGGASADIPNIIGMTHEQASIECEKLSSEDIEFTVIVERSEHSDKKRGTIISQTPEGGREIKSSREIKVVLSLGPVVMELDDYVNKNYEAVEERLTEKGLKVIIQEESNDTYKEGIIFKQIPAEGTKMAEGDEITLFVSRGTENTVVPNVIGKTVDEAMAAIERSLLVVGEKTELPSHRPKGEVVKLSKDANEIVPVGTVVDIYISSGSTQGNSGEVIEGGNSADPKPLKTTNVTLTGLPKNKDVLVELKLGGRPYYVKTHKTSSGSVTISIKIEESASVDVYYDGVYITTKEVKY